MEALLNILQRLRSNQSMRLHHLKFIRGERPGFEQDLIQDAHLADIMQRAGVIQPVAIGLIDL